MATPAQCAQIELILVRPRNPLNIGAAARAMANFGLDRLTVVAPWETNWREARSAVGAPELLAQAREVSSLEQAVADCAFVAGTGSLEYRRPEQQVIPLPNLNSHLAAPLDSGGRVALVFGPENHGLTREDLALCHALVLIPTDSRQPSMNLGQAVAVCLYELAARSPAPSAEIHSTSPTAARGETLERLGELVEATMEASHYSPAGMLEANRHDMRVLLHRLALPEKDARRLMGFFRRMLRQLNPPGRSQK